MPGLPKTWREHHQFGLALQRGPVKINIRTDYTDREFAFPVTQDSALYLEEEAIEIPEELYTRYVDAVTEELKVDDIFCQLLQDHERAKTEARIKVENRRIKVKNRELETKRAERNLRRKLNRINNGTSH